MKEGKIDGNVTFYDILVSKGSELASYMRNENIAKKLGDDTYKEEFPIYADEIENRYLVGKKRNEGIKLLTLFEPRKSTSASTLPPEICIKIASHLGDIDIERFIENSNVAKTLGLLDLFIRKEIKEQGCIFETNQLVKEGSTEPIINKFKEILEYAARKSKASVELRTYKDMVERIVGKEYSKMLNTLYSIAEEACSENKKFRNVLNEALEKKSAGSKMLFAIEDEDIGIFVNLFFESLKKDSAVTRSQTEALRSLLKEVRKLGKKGDEIILKIKGNDRIPPKRKEQVSQIYDELCNNNVSEGNGMQEQQPVSHLSGVFVNQTVANLQSREKG